MWSFVRCTRGESLLYDEAFYFLGDLCLEIPLQSVNITF